MRPVARWLVLVAVFGAAVGLLWRPSDAIVHLCLAVLAWIAGEWLVVRWRSDLVARRLAGSRALLDAGTPMRTAWVHHTFTVRTRLHWTGPGGIPYIDLRERVPESLTLLAPAPTARGALRRGSDLELRYSVTPSCMGKVRFEGVTWRLADLQGFFVHRSFLPLVQEYRVLPLLSRAAVHAPRVKRHNLLPPSGRHRHRRAGVGSELLQLREYVPGDPMKSIAWRVSAKRDRLMSKEYESEVPVRCNVLLDTSSGTRLGYPGPTALSRLGEAAAAVAAAAIGGGDPVSLCTFDEARSCAMRSGSGRGHLLGLLRRLCDVVGQGPELPDQPLGRLLPQAQALCDEVYPGLLDRRVNGDGFRIALRRKRARRERLAVVLGEYFRLGPGAPGRMISDDAYCARVMQEFLGAHQVSFPFAAPEGPADELQAERKIDVAARALTRALAHAPDNELFVVVADLLRWEHRTDPLLTAIKVARARHHHVLVVCTWPPELRLPDAPHALPEPSARAPARQVQALLRGARQRYFEMAYRQLRRRLARLKVPCVFTSDTQLARRVAVELEGLRHGAILP